MPNIRIKDIPTTASATSSTDFIGIDGSANGTRKLNAYSPTFGGNITSSNVGFGFSQAASNGANGPVGATFQNTSSGGYTLFRAIGNTSASYNMDVGVGGSAVGGSLQNYGFTWTNNGLSGYRIVTNGGTLAATFDNSQNTTLAGNLTVSGTGNSSVAGTLLVATTTNSSNGKLQLADHTTSAGGIGFGTDISVFRNNSNQLTFQSDIAASTAVFSFTNGSTNASSYSKIRLTQGSASAGFTLGANTSAIYFWTTGSETTALTLDSSQNATFAGTITSAQNNGVTSNILAVSAGSAGANKYAGISFARNNTLKWVIQKNDGANDDLEISDGTSALLTMVRSSGNATFAGKITANGAGSTFKGTTTNDSAAAGYVGEYVSSSVGYAGRQALTTGTYLNVTSISLTAGDWDVDGTVLYEGTGATVTRYSGAVTSTSTAPDADADTFDARVGITTTTGNVGGYPTPKRRISISTTTTIYLVSRGYFSAGTLEVYGRIQARRVR